MDKLGGIDIFSFKAYMEETGFADMRVIWVAMTELLVNSLFALLNIIVLIMSKFLEILEKITIYDLFKNVIYDTSKTIWNALIGAGGRYQTGSLLYVILCFMGLYLFVQWLIGNNFSKKVLHVLTVLVLGFAYFGSISGTAGGIFILDGVQNISKEAVKVIDNLSVDISDTSVSLGTIDVSKNYIGETSYNAYLYVNTGRTDGKYYDNQTEKEESLKDSKLLGTSSDGKFKAVSSKDRKEYIKSLTKGSDDDKEKNRWMSAVIDFLMQKIGYVFSAMIKAIVYPLPYIVIHFFRIIAELLIIVYMLGFPLFLIATFIPSFQNYIVGMIKLFFILSVLPSFGSFMILTASIINLLVTNSLKRKIEINNQNSTDLLIVSFIDGIVSFAIYALIWKYKGTVMSVITGSDSSSLLLHSRDGNNFKPNKENSEDVFNYYDNHLWMVYPDVLDDDRAFSDSTNHNEKSYNVDQEDVIEGEFYEKDAEDAESNDSEAVTVSSDVEKENIDVSAPMDIGIRFEQDNDESLDNVEMFGVEQEQYVEEKERTEELIVDVSLDESFNEVAENQERSDVENLVE